MSAAELRNVGVCALTTALALVSADSATAAFVVDEVRRAALERLAKETALSVAAVRRESTRDQELQILRAWADWYRGALDAIREVEIGGASAGTIAKIDAARREVDRALEQARRQVFSE